MLGWTKETPASFLPHLEGLANRVKELWDAGSIRAGEKNVISEAILGAAAAGAPQLQLSVGAGGASACNATFGDGGFWSRAVSCVS